MSKSKELYEKVELLCQRIEGYTSKAISSKSSVKNNVYREKLTKLINMINYEKEMQHYDSGEQYNREIIEQLIQEEKLKQAKQEDIYNPASDNFYYKDKLEKNNGDIDALIEELKAEDKLGYRNAYIINEIKKYTHPEEVKTVIIDNKPILVGNKNGFSEVFRTIKNLLKRIKNLFIKKNPDKI